MDNTYKSLSRIAITVNCVKLMQKQGKNLVQAFLLKITRNFNGDENVEGGDSGFFLPDFLHQEIQDNLKLSHNQVSPQSTVPSQVQGNQQIRTNNMFQFQPPYLMTNANTNNSKLSPFHQSSPTTQVLHQQFSPQKTYQPQVLQMSQFSHNQPIVQQLNHRLSIGASISPMSANSQEQMISQCIVCQRPITSSQFYVQTGDLMFSHTQCQFQPSPNSSQMFNLQNPGIFHLHNEIELLPEMLQLDIQILHPNSYIQIYSQEGIIPECSFQNQNKLLSFKKLLCNSTSIPVNVGLVSFKWRFFKDKLENSQLNQIEQMNVMNNMNQINMLQRTNIIQEPLNFAQLYNLNNQEVNIGIRKKYFDQFNVLKPQSMNDSVLNISFNYMSFQDLIQNPQMPQFPTCFTIHILKNLSLNFQISMDEFEQMKRSTQQLLQQNPSLQQYLNKPPETLTLNNSRRNLTQNFNTLQINPIQKQNSQGSSRKSSATNSNSDQQNIDEEERKFDEQFLNDNDQFMRQSRNLLYNPRKSQKPIIGIEIMELKDPIQDQEKVRRMMTMEDYENKQGQEVFKDYFKRYTGQSFAGGSVSNDNSMITNSEKYSSNSLGSHTSPDEVPTGLLVPKSAKNKKRKVTTSSSGSKKSKHSNNSQGESIGSQGNLTGKVQSKRANEAVEDLQGLMTELRGNVVVMSKQQYGSKQLQRYLEKAPPELVDFIISEVVSELHNLMSDLYGNYFCQKLMTSASSQQRLVILTELRPNLYKISCDKKGTHSMQCMIDMINMPEEQHEIQEGVVNHILDMAYDINANHVLQKIMVCFKEEKLDFIYQPIMKYFIELSMDQNGLCVIKKLIGKITNEDKILEIQHLLAEHAVKLVQNPYGNYAVQQAIEVWDVRYCEPIFEKLEDHLMQLSVQKFSSNVIEKILEKASYETVDRYMRKLCNVEVMKSLIKNIYGYYVINKLVLIVIETHRRNPEIALKSIQDTIQYATDKSLHQKWQQILDSY
eukprot:403364711